MSMKLEAYIATKTKGKRGKDDEKARFFNSGSCVEKPAERRYLCINLLLLCPVTRYGRLEK